MTPPELLKAQAVQHLVTALATASFEVMSQHVGDVPILVAGIGKFIEEIDRTIAHGFKQTIIAYLSEAERDEVLAQRRQLIAAGNLVADAFNCLDTMTPEQRVALDAIAATIAKVEGQAIDPQRQQTVPPN